MGQERHQRDHDQVVDEHAGRPAMIVEQALSPRYGIDGRSSKRRQVLEDAAHRRGQGGRPQRRAAGPGPGPGGQLGEDQAERSGLVTISRPPPSRSRWRG